MSPYAVATYSKLLRAVVGGLPTRRTFVSLCAAKLEQRRSFVAKFSWHLSWLDQPGKRIESVAVTAPHLLVTN